MNELGEPVKLSLETIERIGVAGARAALGYEAD